MKHFLGALCLVLLPLSAAAGPAEQCSQVRNDDTISPYDPSLRDGLLHAYAKLFPGAHMPPGPEFEAGTHIRCMAGKLLACFTGANLPCGNMNTARDNPGADAFCRSNPDADVVPAFAAGHDTTYSYRCVSGRANITGATFKLDARGFAASLWAPVQ
jgi:hypothetical protein